MKKFFTLCLCGFLLMSTPIVALENNTPQYDELQIKISQLKEAQKISFSMYQESNYETKDIEESINYLKSEIRNNNSKITTYNRQLKDKKSKIEESTKESIKQEIESLKKLNSEYEKIIEQNKLDLIPSQEETKKYKEESEMLMKEIRELERKINKLDESYRDHLGFLIKEIGDYHTTTREFESLIKKAVEVYQNPNSTEKKLKEYYDKVKKSYMELQNAQEHNLTIESIKPDNSEATGKTESLWRVQLLSEGKVLKETKADEDGKYVLDISTLSLNDTKPYYIRSSHPNDNTKMIEKKVRILRSAQTNRFLDPSKTNESVSSNEKEDVENSIDESMIKPYVTVYEINKDVVTETLDGEIKERKIDAKPFIRLGRTMLPIREISNTLGLEANYNKNTKTIVFVNKYNPYLQKQSEVILHIDTNKIIDGNNEYQLEVFPTVINGRVFLPITSIAKIFGVPTMTEEELTDLVGTEIENEIKNAIIWSNKKKAIAVLRFVREMIPVEKKR